MTGTARGEWPLAVCLYPFFLNTPNNGKIVHQENDVVCIAYRYGVEFLLSTGEGQGSIHAVLRKNAE